jgi:hypothetical protein
MLLLNLEVFILMCFYASYYLVNFYNSNFHTAPASSLEVDSSFITFSIFDIETS